MRFWRVQDTRQMEAQSLHSDIAEILIRKENEDIEDLLNIYQETIDMREDPESLRDALREGGFEDIEDLTQRFPLPGLCGYATEDEEPPKGMGEAAAGTKFLMLYEGEWIGSCGDGDVFIPSQIIKIEEV